MSKLKLFTSFILLFTSFVTADVINTIDACNFKDVNFKQGLHGTIYDYPTSQQHVLSQSDYYLNGYKNENTKGTFDMSNLNFDFQTGTNNFYGVDIKTDSFAIEVTGYFKGMYYII